VKLHLWRETAGELVSFKASGKHRPHSAHAPSIRIRQGEVKGAARES